jgi:hypothetical protein
MSQQSSNPVRQLRYDNTNAALGVPYLQTLGVKYVMVYTEAARKQADLQPELTLVRSSGPWNIYSVAGSQLVEPLAYQLVVVDKRSGDPRERNLELGMSWFQHRDEWAAMPADDGPAEWQRIDVAPDLTRREDDRVDIVQPVQPIEAVPLEPVTISNIDLGDQDLSFTVDKVGVPVLVKISYFPNWNVSGAEGPYRIAPNLMVVIPTDTEVHLTYGRSGLDVFAYLLTILGIGMLVFWRFKGDDVHRSSEPFAVAAVPPSSVWAPTVLVADEPVEERRGIDVDDWPEPPDTVEEAAGSGWPDEDDPIVEDTPPEGRARPLDPLE